MASHSSGGALTRYDGWFVAPIIIVIIVWMLVLWWRRTTDRRQRRTMAKSFAEVLLLNALVPNVLAGLHLLRFRLCA